MLEERIAEERITEERAAEERIIEEGIAEERIAEKRIIEERIIEERAAEKKDIAGKRKENAAVVSQEELAEGIFSMWIHTEAAQSAKPGQFISMYTNDNSKLLPRPVSICEIDRKAGNLRAVYRVTGKNTGTEQFSRLRGGDTIPIIGPLGMVFPLRKPTVTRCF